MGSRVSPLLSIHSALRVPFGGGGRPGCANVVVDLPESGLNSGLGSQRAKAEEGEVAQVGERVGSGLEFSSEPRTVMASYGFDEAARSDDRTLGEVADPMEQLADQS